VGVGPEYESQGQGKQKGIEEFVLENKSAWNEVVSEHGLKRGSIEAQNWRFVEFMPVDFDFDREYDPAKARSVGFEEEC
jgi:hypothetical protein